MGTRPSPITFALEFAPEVGEVQTRSVVINFGMAGRMVNGATEDQR